MDYSLNEEQRSMMQSVSKNIKGFELNPQPLHSSPHGQIFRLDSPRSHHALVLKVVFKKQFPSTYKHEKKIHHSLKNRYVVQMQNCFEDEACSYLVLEHCQGNLRTAMRPTLPLEQVREFGLQIVRGIHYLHKNKVIHHDIKPENILLTAGNQVKLCDFGLAARFQEGQGVKGCEGTLAYAPPEAIETHDQKFDVWSLGCLLHEMATGKTPFPFHSLKELTSSLNQNYLSTMKFEPLLPPLFVHLLKRIFVFDRRQRLSIDQVIKHSFFTGESLSSSEKHEKQEKHEKHENRPLAVKKRTKTMVKSVESVKSMELKGSKENKENLDRENRAASRKNMPNYKEMLQKKFKGESRPNSGERKGSKTNSQYFKSSKESKVAPKGKEEGKKGIRGGLSPLNTLNMRIAPLRLNNSEVRIDREGITRETVRGRTVQGHTTQLITISPDGSLIQMQKGKKEKSYSFETLPQEYHREYEECKRILQEVQAEEPRVSYTDHCFMGHRTLELQVMYSDKLRVRVEDCICLEGLSAEELLANTRGIEEQVYLVLRELYLRLVSLHKPV